jgi:quinol monooxygenase YgiN
MSLIVAGTFRIPSEHLAAVRPHLDAVIEATRKEEGCEVYSYGLDVQDQGLYRVFERWRDQACLDAHFATPHMKAWQAARAEFGFSDRRISIYEVASEREV